jgi:hypothetical protein
MSEAKDGEESEGHVFVLEDHPLAQDQTLMLVNGVDVNDRRRLAALLGVFSRHRPQGEAQELARLMDVLYTFCKVAVLVTEAMGSQSGLARLSALLVASHVSTICTWVHSLGLVSKEEDEKKQQKKKELFSQSIVG